MKLITSLLFFVALSPAVVAADGPAEVKKKINALLLEADRFSSTGRHDLAIKRCEQVLELDPQNVSAREVITREITAAAQVAEKSEWKALHPTYPPQEIRTLPEPNFFK